jgi:hypothetical protein
VDTSLPENSQTVATSCPQCYRTGRVPQKAVGHYVRCPACKHRFLVTDGGVPVEEVALVEEAAEEIPTVPAVEEIPVVTAAPIAAVEVEVVEEVVDVEVV